MSPYATLTPNSIPKPVYTWEHVVETLHLARSALARAREYRRKKFSALRAGRPFLALYFRGVQWVSVFQACRCASDIIGHHGYAVGHFGRIHEHNWRLLRQVARLGHDKYMLSIVKAHT